MANHVMSALKFRYLAITLSFSFLSVSCSANNEQQVLTSIVDETRELVSAGKFKEALEAIAPLENLLSDESSSLHKKIDRFFQWFLQQEGPSRMILSSPKLVSEGEKHFSNELSEIEKNALFYSSTLLLNSGPVKKCEFLLSLLYVSLNAHSRAQYSLGRFLGKGGICNLPANPVGAAYWYEKAANNGLSAAQVHLAASYLTGTGVERDKEKAQNWLKKAITEGDRNALYLMGVLKSEGGPSSPDFVIAKQYLEQASNKGLVKAQIALGELLWAEAIYSFRAEIHPSTILMKQGATRESLGVDLFNEKKRILWEEHNARTDHAIVLYQQSRAWLQKAAEIGNAEAQYKLAQKYVYGPGEILWQYEKAIKWYKMAAELGHLDAQSELGILYSEGDFYHKTVKPDHNKAVFWLKKAAERGHTRAQLHYGYALMEGKGVETDKTSAVEWYRKAAEKGNARAFDALGYAYKNGLGVNQDLRESRRWFRLAAHKGSEGAKQELKGGSFSKLDSADNAAAVLLGVVSLMIATGGQPESELPDYKPHDYFANPVVPWDVVQGL